MKWVAFPSLSMALSLSSPTPTPIQLDEEREMKWQIEAYFSLPSKSLSSSSFSPPYQHSLPLSPIKESGDIEGERLLKVVGCGVDLPIKLACEPCLRPCLLSGDFLILF